MSLFGSIRLASNALRADQIALQVVGQNIANANTPGYIREEVVLSPAATQTIGTLSLGLGVQVDSIVQKLDKYLEGRLQGAISDRASTAAQEDTYLQLEQIVGETTDTDISTAMTDLFNSISDILNQPEDVSVRNLAVLNAKTLTERINWVADSVNQLRSDINDRVVSIADEINTLVEKIRSLNVKIAEIEGGTASKSVAVGLRDQRVSALEELAGLVDIRVAEQDSGSVTVYVGGEFLVADGMSRSVEAVLSGDRGMEVASVRLRDSNYPLSVTSGELYGQLVSRDEVLGGFLDQLDDFAATLAFEFNKVYSSGQGLHGYDTATSTSYVTDAGKPLNQAGLAFTPVNGAFQILVYDAEHGTTQTTSIAVHLLGDDTDTTLQDVADAIRRIDSLDASVTSDGRLAITSKSADHQFAFAGDTSGLLAAIGINTLFTGSTALSLGVNEAVASDPAKFAASRGGIGADTANAVALAAFAGQPIASRHNESITTVYDRLVAEMTQRSTAAQTAAESARTFEETLNGQKLAISGVSVDEEAVNLLMFQKAFQAMARYISVLNDIFDTLVNL